MPPHKLAVIWGSLCGHVLGLASHLWNAWAPLTKLGHIHYFAHYTLFLGGYGNRAVQAVAHNTEMPLPHLWPGKTVFRVPAWWGSSEASGLVCNCHLMLCPHMTKAESKRRLSWNLCEDTNPIGKVLSLGYNSFLMAPSPNTFSLGIRIPVINSVTRPPIYATVGSVSPLSMVVHSYSTCLLYWSFIRSRIKSLPQNRWCTTEKLPQQSNKAKLCVKPYFFSV